MSPLRAFGFSGEVVIVTGAALVDFSLNWTQETKRMIEEEEGTAEVIHADVMIEESCKSAVARTVELFGTVHFLVNIVAVGVGGAMGDAVKLNVDAWERDFRISVTCMILMSRHVTPEMRENGRAVIVNMSSVSGCVQSADFGGFRISVLRGNSSLLYPTSKGAVIQMNRAMAAQHGPENIRVNCVAPGMV
ncbi:hypothetical protein G7054_g1459 [Neopestalotiopsis clavispora]|nr:hypothetical protein G7054_g1459 [Neopestalotiopsis clavispora]